MKINWKKALLRVGMETLKIAVPGVATMEDAIQGLKKGEERAQRVEDLVTTGLQVAGTVTNQGLLSDPEFAEGIKLQVRGTAMIMNALKRHDVDDAAERAEPARI